MVHAQCQFSHVFHGGVSPSSIDFPDDVGTWSWKGDRNVRAPWLSWFLAFSCYSHAQLQKTQTIMMICKSWHSLHLQQSQMRLYILYEYDWVWIFHHVYASWFMHWWFVIDHSACNLKLPPKWCMTLPASKKLFRSGRFPTIFSGHPSRAVGDPWWRSNSRDKMSKCKICPSG